MNAGSVNSIPELLIVTPPPSSASQPSLISYSFPSDDGSTSTVPLIDLSQVSTSSVQNTNIIQQNSSHSPHHVQTTAQQILTEQVGFKFILRPSKTSNKVLTDSG